MGARYPQRLGLETPARRMAMVAGMVMGFMLIPLFPQRRRMRLPLCLRA